MKFLTIFFIILPSLAFSEMKLFECKSQNIKMNFNFNFNEQSYSMIRDYKTNNVDMFIPFIKKGEIYLNEYKLSNHELFLLGSDNSFLNVLIRVKKGTMEYYGYLEFRPSKRELRIIPPVLSNLKDFNGKC